VVLYGGKTILRWRTVAILKIDISPYLNEKKSSDLYEILYTAANFELDERHVIKNEKVALDRLRVRQNVFLVFSLCLSCELSRCPTTTAEASNDHAPSPALFIFCRGQHNVRCHFQMFFVGQIFVSFSEILHRQTKYHLLFAQLKRTV